MTTLLNCIPTTGDQLILEDGSITITNGKVKGWSKRVPAILAYGHVLHRHWLDEIKWSKSWNYHYCHLYWRLFWPNILQLMHSTATRNIHALNYGCIQNQYRKGRALFSSIPPVRELEKANRANIEFNKGVEAGHLRTLTFNSTNQLNCPSGNSKEFCSGWKSATQFTLQQYKPGLTARGN
jgi:hypothetical protein